MADLMRLEAVTAGYGDAVVLEEVSLALDSGGSLALLGRNGAGKTTLVLTIMGFTRVRGGRLRFGDADLGAMPSYRRARAGLGWVPQERWVFPSLTVEEHLTSVARPGHWDLARLFALLPRLEERRRNRGNQLSGGEQQMLAIGRALMTNPKLLILDEATEGLAPLIRQEIWNCLRRLKSEGQAILVIDKNVGTLVGLADRHYIVEKGRVVWSGTSAELGRDSGLQQRYLGV